MKLSAVTLPSCYKKISQDSLYKNSSLLLLSYLSLAFSGFIFWLVCAKLYSSTDVGIASTLYAMITLVLLVSRFGLEQSVIRFSQEIDKDNLVYTSATLSTALSVVLGLVLILFLNHSASSINITREYYLLLLTFIVANSVINIAGVSFLALRKAQYYLIQTIIIGLKIPIVLILTPLGFLGIICAIGFPLIFAALLSMYFLYTCGLRKGNLDIGFIRASFKFSLANYLSSLFITAPGTLLPIIVFQTLDSSATALYYIAFSIASVLLMISNAVCNTLFVEGNYTANIRDIVINSTKIHILLLFPAVVFILLFGGQILAIFGGFYENGYSLLGLMALGSIFSSICYEYFAIQKIKKNNRSLIIFSGIAFILHMSLSVVFIHPYGIAGLGYAWILGYGTTAGAIMLHAWVKNEQLFQKQLKI